MYQWFFAAVVPERSRTRAALAIPAPGERTISNAEVPLPRSPLSLATGTARREPTPVSFAPSQGTTVAGRTSAAGVHSPRRARGSSPVPVSLPAQSRGCKGRSPLHKKTKNLPLPRRGRGSGGWGKEGKLKAGLTGDKEGAPPRRASQRQGQPATNRDKPPLGTWFAPCISAASGSVPGMQGASPLASPALNRLRHWLDLPRGRAFSLARLSCL